MERCQGTLHIRTGADKKACLEGILVTDYDRACVEVLWSRYMTILIIAIVIAWLVFSTLLVTIICMNSSRLSRIDEPFKDSAQVAKARNNTKNK